MNFADNLVEASVIERLNLFWKNRLPLIYQNEISECGLACLAMVAGYHGHKTDLRALRKSHSITLKGVTLAQLTVIAQKMHLSTRAIKVEIEDIKMLRCPAILHWDLNHFVVLKSASETEIVIHDPARGIRKLGISEVSKHFTGIALELTPDNKFEKKEERTRITLPSFIKKTIGFKRSLIQIFILSLVLQIFGILAPYYTQMVVDNVLVGHDYDLLAVLGIGSVILAFITMAISLMRTWMGIFFDSTYSIQLNSSLLKHMLFLPSTWFETRHIGDILSRFGSLKAVQNSIVSGIVGGTLNIITVLVTFTAMFIYSPKLTLITISGICGYILLRVIFFYHFREATEESIVKSAEETSAFVETVNSAIATKIFSKEAARHGRWLNRVVDTMNANIKLHKLSMIFEVCQTTISTLEAVAMLWVGANLVMANHFTIGMLFAFGAWRGQFVGGAYGIVNSYFDYKMLDIHLDRVADIALAEREGNLDGDMQELNKDQFMGKIELINVSYRFGSEEPWIIRNFNLTIEPGECITLVAPSGYGKTTLLKIMMGLITPQEGEVLIDGMPIKKIGLKQYRNIIAAVMQSDKLLSGTVEENISFFDEEINQDLMVCCAKMANIHDEIMKMPLGYKSIVGELGNMLSGGQQQRVLLARALYRQPKILFLDESTSHLDQENADFITNQILQMNITRLQISHQRNLAEENNRIIDLTKYDSVSNNN
jgi:ATP-binding cassette subfamily B protein RaxB